MNTVARELREMKTEYASEAARRVPVAVMAMRVLHTIYLHRLVACAYPTLEPMISDARQHSVLTVCSQFKNMMLISKILVLLQEMSITMECMDFSMPA